MTFVGDHDDPASVLSDARAFFKDWFTTPVDDQANEQASNESDANLQKGSFEARDPGYWGIGERLAALVQVYDLVAPLDPVLGTTYLRRLKYLVQSLLDCRDDKQTFYPPETDGSRHRVMPAWGRKENNRDGRWNTDVDTSGLFVYPMAAFAHRVARNPAHHAEFGPDAIRMITAVIETFQGFHDELHLTESDPYAFFTVPQGYGDLKCDSHGSDDDDCETFRSLVGKAIPYNQNLSLLQALAQLALAADSAFFRQSTDASPFRVAVATKEAPLIVAKGVAFFADHLRLEMLEDGSPYFQWDYALTDSDIEDVSHGQFELGCLAAILEEHEALDQLLARNGRSERIRPLSFFAPMANTFLRKVWRNNSLSHDVNGDGDKPNKECTGWISLSRYDPWVWLRSREAIYHTTPPDLTVGNHAALLRYRRFSIMKFLTEFGGQNWIITPVATAVGEPPPASIHDQKWMVVLSGVVIANQRGDNTGDWNHQTVSFTPDMAGSDAPGATSGPLNWAIQRWRIPRPPGAQGTQYLIRFSVEEWSPFVSPNAMLNLGESINSGFAVDTWRPNSFGTATNVLTNQPVGNLFSGVNADLAVRDNDAWLYRLGYNITLIGKIVFVYVQLT